MRASDVFELLRDGHPRTRAQLIESTGMARSTVTARIDVLSRLGLVAPYGDAKSTGGRPPALIAFNPRAWVVAGVDIGATHAVAALTDLSGAVLGEVRAELEVADGPTAVLDWVNRTVTRLLRRHAPDGAELAAIGIGLPGPVEHSSGRAISPPIMPGWDRFDTVGHVQRVHDVPVLVDNDVNIMALGEQQAVLPDVDDLVFIKVATGIGAGIISGGRLQRGAQGTAGDLGHVAVPHGPDVACRCGNVGCLEAIAAAPALARALREAGIEASSSQDIVDLVRAGDATAIRMVRQAGRDIGSVLAAMVNLINPSVVVLGGRLVDSGEHLLAGIREVVYQRSLPLATEQLQILATAAGPGVGVRGAAAMATAHVLSPDQIDQAGLRLA